MLWTLDTCGFDTSQNCQVEVDSNFNFIRFLRRCPDHEPKIAADQSGFDAIRDENARGSSNALDHIIKNAPAAFVDTLPDGSKQLKAGINVTWARSGTIPNRILTVTITGITLTQQQRNTITAFLDNRFNGKVVLGA